MIPLEEAQAYILDRVSVLAVHELSLEQSLGFVAAEDVVAREAVPPFANSAMDGFAVRSEDTADPPAYLKIIGTVPAGRSIDIPVNRGQAIRIMTGAPIPSGADAVVPVEVTSCEDETVVITVAAKPGDSIRGPGEDVQPGDVVLAKGAVVTPSRIGVLASVAIDRVVAYRKPRVGVLATGDELVSAGPLGPGQIRNSNGPALKATLQTSGLDVVDLGIARDDERELAHSIAEAAESCDALLVTGGVSMGDFDFVKKVIQDLGEMRWMQVAIKPAKPLAFGMIGLVPVFGLPGNPVSSLVSFELFARPALRLMSGRSDLYRPWIQATAVEGFKRTADGKVHFVRVRATELDGIWSVQSAGGQGSHQLAALAHANALACIPDGEGLPPQASVRTMLLTDA